MSSVKCMTKIYHLRYIYIYLGAEGGFIDDVVAGVRHVVKRNFKDRSYQALRLKYQIELISTDTKLRGWRISHDNNCGSEQENLRGLMMSLWSQLFMIFSRTTGTAPRTALLSGPKGTGRERTRLNPEN